MNSEGRRKGLLVKKMDDGRLLVSSWRWGWEGAVFAFWSDAMKTIMISFLLALGAVQASAEPELGRAWPTLVARVQARGIDRVGDFTFEEFAREAASVRWRWVEGLPPEDITGNRRSAFYRVRGKEVFVSARPDFFTPEEWAQLELHEVMGAIGLRDDDYSLSTALMLIATLPEGPSLRSLVSELGQGLFRKRQYAGGSSVSGGGDIGALIVKNAVFERLRSRPADLGDDLLEEFPRVRFEPVYVKGAGVALRYTLEQDRNFLTIFVPMKSWTESADRRDAIVENIAFRLRDIFPPLARRQFESLIPKGCGFKDLTLLRDGAGPLTMSTVRTTREWFRRGCGRSIDGVRSWGQGAIPFGGSPEEAAHDFLKCKISLGSVEAVKEIAVSRPATSSLYAWIEALPGGAIWRFTVRISEELRPLEVMVAAEGRGETSGAIPFSAAGPFIAQGTYGDLPVRATCERVDPRERVDHGSTLPIKPN